MRQKKEKIKEESFFDLVAQAKAMLLDRHPAERELIYYVAKLENDLHQAIILAYQSLKEDANEG